MLELKKRKYKKSEVEDLINRETSDLRQQLNIERDKIAELNEENKRLSLSLQNYARQDAIINSAIKAAEEKAEEIKNSAKSLYDLEMQNLKAFSERFSGYFSYITEKYPHYTAVKEAKNVYDKIVEALKIEDSKTAIKAVSCELDKIKSVKEAVFNPKQKIDDYIAATGDGGFDLNEVLNPGELHLEDLCKELGLIEEEK